MNKKKLFVGNLTYSVRENQVMELFSQYGEVISVRILEKKGYGFVEMGSEEQADAARTALSETEFEGRNLLIDGVRPQIKKRPKPAPKKTGGNRDGRPDHNRLSAPVRSRGARIPYKGNQGNQHQNGTKSSGRRR
ncbi:MAG TPA: RNA-binding protein [Methanospirillum sp.]|nr:RNA-binding protein [Methanospirillum sp.]